ncbi:MAG: glycosyltransferase [Oscillospiraceae bacterium]|nr:glycosyltransferase [Oscillospiraceae bacterium]
MKQAYLISCSDHYGHRLSVFDFVLQKFGYTTAYLTSDFSHTAKEAFHCDVPGCVQLHVRPYRKNLSLDRILSHREFAREVFQYLEALPEEPQAVVCLLPPNFLAKYMARYKKRHPSVRLFFDIFDLWPETFPFGKTKRLLALPFSIWSRLRDCNLFAADYVFTECELFRCLLGLPDDRASAIFLCVKSLSVPEAPVSLRSDGLDLCYLGAINNVIDIPAICALIAELAVKKPVALHIIGAGEREQEFVASAKAAGAEVSFYGAVYDDAKKQEIMSRCHLGINMMKPSVCVGLTMKSAEYFRHGLPILNNIAADTQTLVEQDGVGIQCAPGCAKWIAAMTEPDFLALRENVRRVFTDKLEESVVARKVAAILETVL